MKDRRPLPWIATLAARLGATGANVVFGTAVPAWQMAAPPLRAHPAHERAGTRTPSARRARRAPRA